MSGFIVESSFQTSPDVPRWYIRRLYKHWTKESNTWEEVFGWTSKADDSAIFLTREQAQQAMKSTFARNGRECRTEYCQVVAA